MKQEFESVWDALTDTPEQSANMQARSELMQQITTVIKQHEWTQAQAAQQCGLTQPRINDLMTGKLSKFTIDALINIAVSLGLRVHFVLEAA